MTVQADLCRTLSETPKTGFLASQLIFENKPLKYTDFDVLLTFA